MAHIAQSALMNSSSALLEGVALAGAESASAASGVFEVLLGAQTAAVAGGEAAHLKEPSAQTSLHVDGHFSASGVLAMPVGLVQTDGLLEVATHLSQEQPAFMEPNAALEEQSLDVRQEAANGVANGLEDVKPIKSEADKALRRAPLSAELGDGLVVGLLHEDASVFAPLSPLASPVRFGELQLPQATGDDGKEPVQSEKLAAPMVAKTVRGTGVVAAQASTAALMAGPLSPLIQQGEVAAEFKHTPILRFGHGWDVQLDGVDQVQDTAPRQTPLAQPLLGKGEGQPQATFAKPDVAVLKQARAHLALQGGSHAVEGLVANADRLSSVKPATDVAARTPALLPQEGVSARHMAVSQRVQGSDALTLEIEAGKAPLRSGAAAVSTRSGATLDGLADGKTVVIEAGLRPLEGQKQELLRNVRTTGVMPAAHEGVVKAAQVETGRKATEVPSAPTAPVEKQVFGVTRGASAAQVVAEPAVTDPRGGQGATPMTQIDPTPSEFHDDLMGGEVADLDSAEAPRFAAMLGKGAVKPEKGLGAQARVAAPEAIAIEKANVKQVTAPIAELDLAELPLEDIEADKVSSGGAQVAERRAPAGQTALPGQAAPSMQKAAQSLWSSLSQKIEGRSSKFDIRLDPPELGKVKVSLDFGQDGRVRAHLVVERAETMDMFLRDQRGLEKALAEAGYDGAKTDLQFSMGQQQGGQGQDNEPQVVRQSNRVSEAYREDAGQLQAGVVADRYDAPGRGQLNRLV